MSEDSSLLSTLEKIGAVWHSSTKNPVHVKLSSGLHSDLYIDIWALVSRPGLLAYACNKLLKESLICYPEWFFGPERGEIPIAVECGRILGRKAGFVSKTEAGMELLEFMPKKNSTVVIVDDVLTTGGSIIRTWHALERARCLVYPTVCVMVNRSGVEEVKVPSINATKPSIKVKIKSVVSIRGNTWDPTHKEGCPLCKESKALLPEQIRKHLARSK
jgi:orotate phosphoribosyltransferase